jgi:glycosyltransferase involved in cell wall biosynthesis
MLWGTLRSAYGAGLIGPTGLLLLRAKRSGKAKKWTKAAVLYRKYLERRPSHDRAWVQYGHVLKESGLLAEGERAYRHALTLRPDVADTYLQLGHILKIAGSPENASRAYRRSAQLDSARPDARMELERLAAYAGGDDEGYADECESALPLPNDADLPTIVFDVSDLIAYFASQRLPTGIQRVQIEIIAALLRQPREGREAMGVCVFVDRRDHWTQIPEQLFLKACDLARSGGAVRDPEWMATLHRIRRIKRRSEPMRFACGAVIVNLGTSWLQKNYFLNVRNAKAQYGVRYVPFVHDLIPVLMPEHFVRDLTEDFIAWVLGVFDHADHFLVNSESTRRDLIEAARRLGHTLPPDSVTVIRLNADFGKPDAGKLPAVQLRKRGLEPGSYVLFVSTVESRKNHLGAFSAWLALLEKHGAEAIPKLVCVGTRGWLNAGVYAKLETNKLLKSRVVMLSKLSDDELASLYAHCRFTLYPSLYEGWGLPVTESLCHGKVPLLSNSSALPEAGGEFADYFELGSEESMLAGLERLIFDTDYLRKREQKIRDSFRPRSWSDLGALVEQVAAQVRQKSVTAADDAGRPAKAELGVYYPMTRNQELRMWPGMTMGEIFRMGSNWWGPENWGAWTKPGGGKLGFRVRGPHGRLRVYFGLSGLQREECDWSIELKAPARPRLLAGHLGRGESKWVTCEFPANETDTTVILTLHANTFQDLRRFSRGGDPRIISVGFQGFYVCEAEDALARADFAEGVLTGDFRRLQAGAREREN